MPTKEELMQFFGTDEGKGVMAEIGWISGDQHTAILGEQTKGLSESKTKILSEKKLLEDKFKSVLPKVEAIDKLSNILKSHEIVLDENGNFNFDTLEDLIVKGKTGSAGGDTVELNKNLTKAQREKRDLELEFTKFKTQFEEVGTSLNTANQYIEKLLIEDGLRKEIVKLKDIPEELHDSLIIVLKQRSGAYVEVDTENPDNRRAVTKEGDTIARYIELWKETPEGKTFRRAPLNSGGGAGHSGSGGYGNKKWADMTLDDRTALFKENPDEYHRRKSAK
jgi:hypothetical protein